jgi:lysophospholipase L1-like esterase
MAKTTRVADRVSFLALGDSYTIGEGVAARNIWPAQLVARLRKCGHTVDDARIVATTGWTTDELAAAIDGCTFHPPYALVSLLIGVNNQYRGRDLVNYRIEFAALLERAIAFAGDEPRHVIVVSIPDWGMTRFTREQNRDALRIADEIDAFNAANREIAEARGAHWVDVTAASRGHGENLLADDGLHPSGDQYTLWVAEILPVARSILETDA